ncbi:30S ribosomal protein S6e [Candidatus Micrarchaeota archaeon CG10_big_fil_rev_8_21_14_0_10_45_29]|nr:MAG: 30S ribosomal protein S6e [Candidatus Micrarchaeota archaeon CG10_big_fil_rev_8_21_14_0_10_45_29]
MKLVISEKDGKSYQLEVPKAAEGSLLGRKVGDEIDGSALGAAGYTLKITGGSDTAGFPMRKDVDGPRKKKLLLGNSPGIRGAVHGERKKRIVRGRIISDEIMQINCIVLQAGAKPLPELFPKKEGEKKE